MMVVNCGVIVVGELFCIGGGCIVGGVVVTGDGVVWGKVAGFRFFFTGVGFSSGGSISLKKTMI